VRELNLAPIARHLRAEIRLLAKLLQRLWPRCRADQALLPPGSISRHWHGHRCVLTLGNCRLLALTLDRWFSRATHSEALAEKVLSPILDDPAARPHGKRGPECSVTPGTRKTSLVNDSARCWAAGHLRACVGALQSWFRHARKACRRSVRVIGELTSCVILFDEFEELFRDRSILTVNQQRHRNPTRRRALAMS